MMSVGLMPNVSYIASAYGIKPQQMQRMLEESHYGGLTDILTLPLNNNTRSDGGNSNSSKSGRPQITNQTEITDDGAVSQEYNTDEEPEYGTE